MSKVHRIGDRPALTRPEQQIYNMSNRLKDNQMHVNLPADNALANEGRAYVPGAAVQ